MTDLIHHYKDREPEETIQIITDFFKSKNISIKKIIDFHSEIDTYSCTYGLYWQGKQILQCNGKGMTKIYSQASCYSELYERFCCYLLSLGNNTFLKKDIMTLKKKQYGYYLYPNEKEISKSDFCKNNFIKNLFQDILPDNDEAYQIFLDIFLNSKAIGMPYKNLINNQIIYQDFSTIFWPVGTTGLATGNTIEEALVQGCSEIFERIVVEKFFKEIQNQYYLIDEKYLNIIFQQKIQILKSLNYEVFLYDLSYNFNIPVCFLLLYNSNQNTLFFKFGAAPVFDIAVERCFTEMYQGFTQMPNNSRNEIDLIHFNEQNIKTYIKDVNKGLLRYTNHMVIPDFLFLNTNNQKYNFNSKIFLSSNNYNNQDLLNHIKKICQFNNLNLNWLNISQTTDIYAVHIVPEEDVLHCGSGNYDVIKSLDQNQKIKLIECWKLIYDFLLSIISSNATPNYDEEQIGNYLNIFIDKLLQINTDPYIALQALNILLCNTIYNPFSAMDVIEVYDNYHNILDFLIENENNYFPNISIPIRDNRKILFEQYRMFIDLINRNYSKDYIKNINNKLNITYIDFLPEYNNSINIFLIYILYIYNIYNIYNSKQYFEYIQMILI